MHSVHVPASFGIAQNHCVECLRDTLPASVAIHGIVASVDGGDLAGVVLAHFVPKLFQISGAAGGESVAAIHEGMDKDAVYTVLFGHL